MNRKEDSILLDIEKIKAHQKLTSEFSASHILFGRVFVEYILEGFTVSLMDYTIF